MANTKITSRVIADNAVTTAAIADDAITSAKLDTNIAVAGTLTVTGDITGTLATAAQPNITSVGTLTGLTTTGDINFGDNDKAIFGASSDLQIYHTGTASVIADSGTGSLFIQGESQIVLGNIGNVESYAIFNTNGAVQLRHDNVTKFSTTSTGIDVTGTATMDGLTVDGSADISGTITAGANNGIIKEIGSDLSLVQGAVGLRINDAASAISPTTASANNDNAVDLGVNNIRFKDIYLSGKLTNDGSGGISVDTSGKVGIGTTSPARLLETVATNAGADITALQVRNNNSSTSTSTSIRFVNSTSGTSTAGGAEISAVRNASDGGALTFKTAADSTATLTERVRIEAATNGIYAITSNSEKAGGILNASSATNSLRIWADPDDQRAATNMEFYVDATERMRITSAGEVCINNTFTGGKLQVKATGSDTSNWCERYYTTGTESTLYVVDFIDYQGQRNGYISANPVANTVAYVTSSDYRLKENVDYTWDATTRLKQLKPARFNWTRDESNTLVDGFLAHEVEDIVPEAISGEKDATETKTNAVVNAYGNYIAENVTEEEWLAGKEDGTYDADTTWAASHTQNLYQGIDQSKLVPLLTKALQEQQTIIDDLKSRIETLEG